MIHHGDALEVLRKLKDCSVDSLVTDPPAGIAFMGKDWDNDKGGRDEWISWMRSVMSECYRVMKPGAHGFVWALPRTSHWTATALEDAGFNIRDVVTHLFGSGFPKSHDVSKAIDKAAGAERKVVGKKSTYRKPQNPNGWDCTKRAEFETAPSTPEAKQWEGWGTALKPANEHWILIRKPLSEKTVAKNVLKWGTGALNIDGCRIEAGTDHQKNCDRSFKSGIWAKSGEGKSHITTSANPEGRFPANLIVSGEAREVLDEQSGERPVSGSAKLGKPHSGGHKVGFSTGPQTNKVSPNDSGGASRFFFDGADPPFLYCAKASKRERNEGLDKFYNAELDLSQCKEENTEVVALLLKAIFGSMPSLSTDVCGDRITVTSPRDTLSITKTTILQITESKILNWLTHSRTSDCTQDVNCEMEHGGSLAQCARNLNELMSQIGTSPEKDGSLLVDAVPATFKLLSSVKEENAWKPKTNNHPTIKSQRLMRYLCRMVTPPNGTVLDPFMGSGSTGVAALNEGFQLIGIERDDEYIEIARNRLEYAKNEAEGQMRMI